jgi:hypothetical protein
MEARARALIDSIPFPTSNKWRNTVLSNAIEVDAWKVKHSAATRARWEAHRAGMALLEHSGASLDELNKILALFIEQDVEAQTAENAEWLRLEQEHKAAWASLSVPTR